MIELYNADCLEQMKHIADGSVDAIICDPPYGTTACKWDSVIPFDLMWEQLNRLIKPNGAIVLFGSEPFSSALRMSNIKNYKYDLYWKKEKPTNFFQLKKRVGKVTENIVIFYRKQVTYNPQKTIHLGKLVLNKPKGKHKSIVSGFNKEVLPYKDDGTRYPIDILEFRRIQLGKQIHPTQKPVALGQYLIRTYTNKGETILDFTAGSGSFGVAAIREGRKFIGIELDKDYYKIMKERVTKELQSSSDYGIL